MSRPRVVIDTNALISAALSPRGAPAQLLDRVRSGGVEMIMSDHLCHELESRLERERFRRWLSLEEVEIFVDALSLLATWLDDRHSDEVPHVCDDPDDNFLVALYQDSGAHMLVSGDKAVLRIDYPGLHLYKPAEALTALQFNHKWGSAYLSGEGRQADSLRDINGEGNAGIFNCYTTFAAVIQDPTALHLLPLVVVPDTLKYFKRGQKDLAKQLADRGMATRPIYASPEIAYIKLPPDPGVNLRVMDSAELPQGTIFATMQRCPDLSDPPGSSFDHWRVWGIGGLVEPERIRPRKERTR
ncbi:MULTISPECIES: putative toxin-antitoxin system toxin component, PIN family [unclassified Dietzia]|uniref:putative toxin-antitoxin system toxin component, PIN family n=1 Tax=unclassified Dietzia TaxID=2617939 RepID=UPI00131F0B71|nr:MULTISPECIES: putative toxin-antitoxin system toxin component, PIN family [unclassified Dietzia]